MPIGNSITIINRSGKVVSNGKQLASVWQEAKAAYRSKKAELKATRNAEHEERQARIALENYSISEAGSRSRGHGEARRASSVAGSSRSRRSRSGQHEGERRRGSHDPSGLRHEVRYDEDDIDQLHVHHGERPPPYERGTTEPAFAQKAMYSHPRSPPSLDGQGLEQTMVRRHTLPPRPDKDYDEHLAYGELPPPLPVRHNKDELVLRSEMTKLQQLLEEANCVQYSATAMVEHLQKNPDALAAVGLTLAEISTLVKKVGPVAFATMKTSFPAVIALLISPQFLIAGGLAVGVTVVMFGGYKIVKRMQAQKALEGATPVDETEELRELEGQLSSIEKWQRGVADEQAESVGTTVEGEFITPRASQRLMDDGVLQESDFKPPEPRRARSEGGQSTRRAESVRSGTTSKSKKHKHHHSGSRHRSGGSDAGSTRSTSKSTKGGKGDMKKKYTGLSGLKLLLAGKQ